MNFNTSSHFIYLLNIQLFLALNKSIAPSNVHEAETVKSTTFNNTSGNSKSIQKLTTSVTTPKYNFDLEASILLLS